jgi:signal transduction histidine kinase
LELALRYLHKAWEAQRATGNFHDYLIPTMHINYAWIYADIEAIELAEYHAKKAYSFTKIDSLTEVRSGALQVLSYLAEHIGDAELSLNYAKKALKLDRTMNNAYSIAYSEGFLMEVYQGMGRMAEAGILAVSVESALDDYADNPNFAADINEYLYNFYKAQGDAKKALNHLEAATKAKATLNSVDSETVMDQFDAEMKARVEEIGITKTRLQEEKLKFRTILLIASLIALAGVIIFLIFLYASNRKIASVNNLLKERSAVIHDQKKEIEYQKNILTERNQDLEKLNDSKDRLFSILTHDLKQPFNQITGFIDLIKEGMINENERNQLLMDLKSSVANTSSLVTNVLLWSKAQFAGVTVAPKELILANTVKRALLHFSMALDKKGIKVVFEIPENLKIVFDQDHFASVLRNIFSNAYKFSPADATIYISATTDRLLKRAYLSIRDEGVGIDPEQRDKLLNASNTESLSGTFNEMGTGIGMIIVNDFLRENGGSFDIETGLDKGSTFIINLPLSKGTPGSSESKTLSIKSKY